MTLVETELLAALKDLEAAVAALPTSHPKPSLLPRFARINELGARLGPDADPQLAHYLERQSWQKARVWLEDRAAGRAASAHQP